MLHKGNNNNNNQWLCLIYECIWNIRTFIHNNKFVIKTIADIFFHLILPNRAECLYASPKFAISDVYDDGFHGWISYNWSDLCLYACEKTLSKQSNCARPQFLRQYATDCRKKKTASNAISLRKCSSGDVRDSDSAVHSCELLCIFCIPNVML